MAFVSEQLWHRERFNRFCRIIIEFLVDLIRRPYFNTLVEWIWNLQAIVLLRRSFKCLEDTNRAIDQAYLECVAREEESDG